MSKDKSISLDKLTLGVCYYPEHWDESLWEIDLKRMLEHGITVVRVFEFAWTVLEHEEGIFDFTLFDRFLDLAKKCGMKVILCTPTATPPAWLTHRYPEALNSDKEGNLFHHGHRRHYNYNSKIYRRLSSAIVEQLAKRYGEHPAVIGWQIDNEINCEINEFYSNSDHEAFRVYLKERFITLDALNAAVGATFWNQTYTDWEQVSLERKTICGFGNPHLALLEKRFFSRSARGFVKLQAEILKKHIKSQFITTNGLFGHLDSHEMTNECLDFITYDSYPDFAFVGEVGINRKDSNGLKDRAWGLNLSRVRSISPNFGVMEQQSGPGGWDCSKLQPMPKPGQMKLWTMQSVAHGADFISYFRWRTCGYGTEIYWHGLNDYSNQPNRRLRELMEISSLFKSLSGLAGSRYQACVGLVCDYLNEWDGERDKWHGPLDSISKGNIFQAAQMSHTPLDLVYIRHTAAYSTGIEELLHYKLLFYPHPTILTEKTTKLLEEYVRQGGMVVFGSRTGYKDEFGRCPMMPMPGFASDLCGLEVEDYTLASADEPVRISFNDESLEAPVFHDVLAPSEGTEVIGNFEGGWYSGRPALTRKAYPSGGAAYYLGSGFSAGMTTQLLKMLGLDEPFKADFICPEQVELAMRSGSGGRFCFLLNFSNGPQKVNVRNGWKLAGKDQYAEGQHILAPYSVLVFRNDVHQ